MLTDKKEIKQFLEEIEILPRIMRIDAVSYDTPNTEVAASSTDPNKDQLQATIQLTTFYYVGQLDDQNKTQVETSNQLDLIIRFKSGSIHHLL